MKILSVEVYCYITLPGMTGPPNFAVGPVTLTAILYPQLWIYVTRAAYRETRMP